MKPIKTLTGLILLVLFFASCSGLTELPTSWGNNPASPDIKPTGYNPDTKTGWMSYNDSTHLYFAFSFFDPRFQTLILNTGMTVFIDTTGKMKEGCFVRFPLIKREIIAGVQEGHKLQTRQGGQGRNQRTTTSMLLDQAQGFELQWQKGEEKVLVNPSLDKSGFKTTIGLDTANVLNIVLGVPLNKINPAGLPALDDMVIGLRFGQSPASQSSGNAPSRVSGGTGQPPAGGTGAGTGGGGGGGGRGGRGGGRSGGGGAATSTATAAAGGGNAGGVQMNQGGPGGMDNSPVEFWYKTRMAKR